MSSFKTLVEQELEKIRKDQKTGLLSPQPQQTPSAAATLQKRVEMAAKLKKEVPSTPFTSAEFEQIALRGMEAAEKLNTNPSRGKTINVVRPYVLAEEAVARERNLDSAMVKQRAAAWDRAVELGYEDFKVMQGREPKGWSEAQPYIDTAYENQLKRVDLYKRNRGKPFIMTTELYDPKTGVDYNEFATILEKQERRGRISPYRRMTAQMDFKNRYQSTTSTAIRKAAVDKHFAMLGNASYLTAREAASKAMDAYYKKHGVAPSSFSQVEEDINRRVEDKISNKKYGARAKATAEARKAFQGTVETPGKYLEEEMLALALEEAEETGVPKTKRPGRLARRAFEEFPLRTAVEVGEGKSRRTARSKFGGHLEATERLAGGDLDELERIVDDPSFKAGASTGRERFVSREEMLARNKDRVTAFKPDELTVPGAKGKGATSEDLRNAAMKRLQDITPGEAVAETRRGLGLTAEKRLTAQQRAKTTLQKIQDQIDDLNPQRRTNVTTEGGVKVYKGVKPPRMHRLPADVAEKLAGGNWASPEGKALIQKRIRTLEKRAGILKDTISRGGEAAPQVRSDRLAKLARENAARRELAPAAPRSRTSPVLGGRGPITEPTRLQRLVQGGGRLGTKTKALGFLGALAQPFATAEALGDLFSDDPDRQSAAMEFFGGLEPGTTGRGMTESEKLEQEKAGLPWYDPRTGAGGV